MNSAVQNWGQRHPLLRRLAIDLALVQVFNVMFALIITYMILVGTSFWTNLIFNLCIGTIGMLIVDGFRLFFWGECKPPKLPFFSMLLVAIISARYLGSQMASRLLGIKPEKFTAERLQHAPGFFMLTLLFGLVLTWYFWNRGTLEKLKLQAETEKTRAAFIEKQALQAQLQLLQAQIEPHMLFNTLANLQGLIAIDASRAQQMLDQLILYLRATLTSSRAEKTTLAHEFLLMDAYLGLMAVRMGSRLSYALQLPEALREVHIPPMLLQPLIENAIKHGLEPKIEGGSIVVVALLDAGTMKLTVTDTGLGLQAEKPALQPSSSGVGLSNVRERLQALYGADASLTLNPNLPAGVIAQLNLPI